MNILLLETATEICSVGVASDGKLVGETTATGIHQHASHLTLLIQEVLETAKLQPTDLNFIALSSGPGSYTSLRVGAATAKGLCFAIDGVQLLAVDTLRSLALSTPIPAVTKPILLPTINSRRDEVYTQAFTPQGDSIDDLRAATLTANAFADLRAQGQLIVSGSGTDKVAEHLGELDNVTYLPQHLCRAAHLLPLAVQQAAAGRTSDYATYEPRYLKPPFVTKSTKKLL